jgi:hypothetical protein
VRYMKSHKSGKGTQYINAPREHSEMSHWTEDYIISSFFAVTELSHTEIEHLNLFLGNLMETNFQGTFK